MSGVQILRVGEDEGEQRLDRWLRKRFPQLNQIAIEKLCRTGQIRVDAGRVKPATRIGAGQEIRLPPLPDAAPAPAAPRLRDSDAEMIQAAGGTVRVHDPRALPVARAHRPGPDYVDTVEEAVAGSHVVLHLTEWQEYRDLDPAALETAVHRPVVIDGRNRLDPARWRHDTRCGRRRGDPVASGRAPGLARRRPPRPRRRPGPRLRPRAHRGRRRVRDAPHRPAAGAHR